MGARAVASYMHISLISTKRWPSLLDFCTLLTTDDNVQSVDLHEASADLCPYSLYLKSLLEDLTPEKLELHNDVRRIVDYLGEMATQRSP